MATLVTAQPLSRPPAADFERFSALMNAGSFVEVEAGTRPLLEQHPNMALLWKLHAGALLFQGKDSRAAFERAHALAPQDPEISFHYGSALHDFGDAAAAVPLYRRAIAAKPDLAEAHDALGNALLGLGKAEEAADSHRQALRLKPKFPEAHGNLGNALVELGKLDEAVFHYRRMLEFRPTMAEAHNNLGNALLALRRYDEAAAAYRRAVELKPDAVGAHANLGNVLRELGRTQEAEAHCRRAIELEPRYAEAYRLLGNVQFDLGRPDEAVASYRQAVQLEPKSVEVHIALGKVMRQTGQSLQAEHCCRAALEVKPDSAEAMALLAEILADRGRFADAESLLRRAARLSPELPEAWAALARYRKMGSEDGPWLEAAQYLLSKPLPIGQEINLRNALGKYFDDTKSYDEAFDSYRRANELKKKVGELHDRARVSRRVDSLLKSYDRVWFDKVRALGSDSERPIFIVGLPRSGTTLTEQILASHPCAYGAGELRFWHAASAEFESMAPRGAALKDALEGIAARYLALLEGYTKDALRVVDKMPANFMNLGLIHAAFPRARIIHMQRNVMDTGLSIYFQALSATHSYAKDLSDIAHYILQYRRLMQHWRGVLPPKVMLEVPYEELVVRPETWIRRILDFVGLPFDVRCLNFHETERTVVTASNWQVRQKMTAASAGRWRNYERHLGPLRELAET